MDSSITENVKMDDSGRIFLDYPISNKTVMMPLKIYMLELITGFDWRQLYNNNNVDSINPASSKVDPVFTINSTDVTRNDDVVDLTSLLISHDIATISDQVGSYIWNIIIQKNI